MLYKLNNIFKKKKKIGARFRYLIKFKLQEISFGIYRKKKFVSILKENYKFENKDYAYIYTCCNARLRRPSC